MLRDEGGLAIVAEQAGSDGDGAAGVENMNDRLAVVRRDLDGRVGAAGGRAADEQGQLEALTLHLARDVHHLVERRRDEPAEADDVGLFRPGALEDLFAGHHHAHVDDLVVVAGQHDADDVLADVVHVALHRGEHDLALRLDPWPAATMRGLLRLHERRQVGDGLLHHARRLHHLRQEHLAGAEQIADHAHAVHQRAFDHRQRPAEFGARFLGVGIDVGVDALDQGVREALLDGAVAPLFSPSSRVAARSRRLRP